jgi:hypothetical protein
MDAGSSSSSRDRPPAGGTDAPGVDEGSGKLSRDADQRLKTLTDTMPTTVAEHGSQLPTVAGIGHAARG